MKLTSGQSPSGFRFGSTGKPYFKVDQLGKSSKYLDRHQTPYTADELPEVPAGSVLIAKRGGAIALNRVRVLREPGFMDTNVMALTPGEELDSEFLYYWLAYRGLWDIADVTSVPQINNKHINPLELPLPSLDEQRVIVRALNGADNLIASVESSVAKKRYVKQGMMQELLTGRTRLPGFTDDWAEAPLADVSILKGRIGWQGLKQEEFTTNPSDPFLITGMNFKDGEIRWAEVYHVSDERYEVAPEIQLCPDDVLMTKDGTIGKLLYVDHIPSPGRATLNSHLLLFRPKHGAYDPRFLYYQLGSPRFAEHIDMHKSGTTFFGISQTAVGKYRMLLPSIHEQRAIGCALADADREVAALERRLESARAVKIGMMQELLTGRTRLPLEEEA